MATLMALLGGGVVGVVVTDRARSALREHILSDSLAAADLASALVASYIGEAQATSRELASRPTLQTAAGNHDFSSLNLDLERWSVEHPNLSAFITDIDGIKRATNSTDKSTFGQDRGAEDYFQGAITTGQPFLGAPSRSSVTNLARVPYAVPLRDEAGVVRGVLVVSIQLDTLSNIITSIHVGHNARASLTDLERAILLAHPDPSRILSQVAGQNLAALRMKAGERGVLEDTTSLHAVLAESYPAGHEENRWVESTLRVAIVGAGMIGRAHARAFRTLGATFQPAPARVELTVLADADLELARDAQVRWEVGRVVPSWREVVDADDVDIACVGLPNHEHRAAVEALVAAGKHVLCEKPLAPTTTDAQAILNAARQAGVVHGVGFNLRRAPALAAIQGAVSRGVIGEPRQFSARYFTDYAASPEVPFTWRYARSLAGSGALGDVGSHIIDLGRFLVGDIASVAGATLSTFIKQRPVPAGHVTGHNRGATTGETRTVDTDDAGAFICQFAHGALGDFRFSRIATGHRNSPAFDLIGSRGAISFDMERAAEFNVYETQGDDDVLNGFRRVVLGPRHPYFADVVAFPVAGVGYGYSETYAAQAYEFVRAVVERRPYNPSFEDGLSVVQICAAVQESAEQGRSCRLD